MRRRRTCPPTEEWAVTVTVAAQRLNIGRDTAEAMVRDGTLPSILQGRYRRVPVQGIQDLLAEACRKAAERREAA